MSMGSTTELPPEADASQPAESPADPSEHAATSALADDPGHEDAAPAEGQPSENWETRYKELQSHQTKRDQELAEMQQLVSLVREDPVALRRIQNRINHIQYGHPLDDDAGVNPQQPQVETPDINSLLQDGIATALTADDPQGAAKLAQTIEMIAEQKAKALVEPFQQERERRTQEEQQKAHEALAGKWQSLMTEYGEKYGSEIKPGTPDHTALGAFRDNFLKQYNQ